MQVNDTADATSANVTRFSGRIPLPLPNTTITDVMPNITANATLDGTNNTNSTDSTSLLVRIDTDEDTGSSSSSNSGPAVSGFDRVVESIKETAASAGSKVVDLFKSAGDAISGFFG
jgi:hypothetical protein